jgi:uncharacterized protein with PIN domain
MNRAFFDTSALVKCYHDEAGSLAAQAELAHPESEVYISALTEVELMSALAIKVRTGLSTRGDYA